MTLYIYPRTQTGFQSSWWDTYALDIWQFHCQITLQTVCYQPHWKASVWILLSSVTIHRIMLQWFTPKEDLITKIIKFHMSFHFIHLLFFHLSFNAFPHKVTLGPCHGVGIGVEGANLWAWPQGQKVTPSGPKSDVQWVKIWRTQGWKVTYGPKCNIGVL